MARKSNEAGSPKTSRLARGRKLGTLVVGQAVRRASIKAGSTILPADRTARLLDEDAQRAAQHLVRVLGGMKGAAMKIGQMLSLIDLDAVAPERRDAFRQSLATLQADAEPVAFATMRPQIEGDLGMTVEAAFATFDTEPIAAASIGQVYRATLHDGRTVAVKVQYPGIDAAVESDLKILAMLMKFGKTLAPTISSREVIDEIADQLTRELDYVAEQQTQQELADFYRGHPFIVIPATVPERCGSVTLTTEFIDGAPLSSIEEADAATRDRVGEIIYRFYQGALYLDAAFNGDPHPGNIRLLDDGRVAFLDFGMFKTMDRDAVDAEVELINLAAARDAEGVLNLLRSYGVARANSTVTAEECLSYVVDAAWWHLVDDTIRLRPSDISNAVTSAIFPTSTGFQALRRENLPPEHIFSRRLDFLTAATLASIGASGNWFAIDSEWVTGAPPATELGRLDAEWRAARATTD